MKTTIKTTAAILAMIMMAACSSDDSKPAEEPLSERLEYENTTETIIPDGSETGVTIILNVDEDKNVIDPSKIFLEITLDHQIAVDLSLGYTMPSASQLQGIFSGLGGLNKFSRENVLSFNATHTAVISENPSFLYPNSTVPQGNYKQASTNSEFPVETSLFSSMMSKNINGAWKFFLKDDFGPDEGKIIKIKLIFDEGALEVTNN